jgi:hypothetical protein
LKTRGLGEVQLVISVAHAGLRAAIEAVLLGAAWQGCRVHFLRNVLAQVPKVQTMLTEAGPDVTAFADFPNPAALLRLAGSVLVETHDEWHVSDRRYLSEGSMALLNKPVSARARPAARPGRAKSWIAARSALARPNPQNSFTTRVNLAGKPEPGEAHAIAAFAAAALALPRMTGHPPARRAAVVSTIIAE